MAWHYLWDDGSVITAHALAAFVAIMVGAVQFAAPVGTRLHRVLGYVWVAMIAFVAASSFWINQFQTIGPFSAIHVLSAITLVSIWYAVRAARDGRIEAHRSTMASLFVLALLLTGAFTLLPGRTMHAVLFGG
jgi:uncharacterized membrane protein